MELKKKNKSEKSEKPKSVMQGYGLTVAKYKVNLYQKRIMLAVTSAAQARLDGEQSIVGRNIQVSDGEFPILKIPLDMILQDEDSSNVFAVRQAAKKFMSCAIEYEDSDGNWSALVPIITAEMPKYSSCIYIQVHKLFWNAILDYRRGFRRFDANLAMTFKSVYTIRFFEIISGKTEPITYTIDELKNMFQVTKKYKQVNDFVKRVIVPAKEELDAYSPYSFNFKPVKDGRKIIALTFVPVTYPDRNVSFDQLQLQRRLNLSWDIHDRLVRSYLMDTIGFTTTELRNNIDIFRRASALVDDLLSVLELLHGKSRDKDNPKGWIINALKGKVDDILKDLDSKKKQLSIAQQLAQQFDAKNK